MAVVRPRWAQEDHTHPGGGAGLIVATPDLLVNATTSFGVNTASAETVVYPSSPSTEKGVDSIVAVRQGGWTVPTTGVGTLPTPLQYLWFSTNDNGEYSRATGFEFRTIIGVNDAPENGAGYVGLHRRDGEHRAWFYQGWVSDGTAPYESSWAAGADEFFGDGTYWSDVSFYDADVEDWHLVYTRPTGNSGQYVFACYADGHGEFLWTSGAAGAFGSVDQTLMSAGEVAQAQARGGIVGFVCMVKKNAFATFPSGVTTAASDVNVWLPLVEADTTYWQVTAITGVGPVPEPYALSSFIGARFHAKGTGDRFWEFHSHALKNSSYAYSASRGEGTTVATSIPVVDGGVYALSGRCDAGAATATFRITDTSDGAYEEWTANWSDLGWSDSSWLWSGVAGLANPADAYGILVIEHQGFRSPWVAGLAFAP